MARITVEDCILEIPNRFDLVLLAAHRARAIASGEPLTLERDNDKNTVIALREIAEPTIEKEELREALLRGLQRHVEQDEPEEDEMALLMANEQWSKTARADADAVRSSGDEPDDIDAEETESVGFAVEPGEHVDGAAKPAGDGDSGQDD